MTVIAFKDGVMAADTLAQDGQSRYRVQKIARLPDGGVAGMCGTCAPGYAALKWLEEGGSDAGSDDKKRLPDIDGATILIAKPDGTLWLLEDRFPAFPLRDKWTAVGCGGPAALALLGAGFSAVDAVQRVARHDLLCGDPVQSMAVEQPLEYPKAVTHSKRAPAPRVVVAKKARKR